MLLHSSDALFFLIITSPIAFLVAFNDLKFMKIPNILVASLVVIYLSLAWIVFPLDVFIGGIIRGIAMYFIGMFLFMYAGVGAGDGKFAAAFAMYIPLGDAINVLLLFASVLLASFIAHRTLKYVQPIRSMTSDWKSWNNKKFPMGLALSVTMVMYFTISFVL